MQKCSLIMDIGGSGVVETAHYTTLGDPVYMEEGILHYCVDNMPSLVPKTSTEALLMMSGPYLMTIANKGHKKAAQDDISLRRCISTLHGQIVHPEIGINQDLPYTELTIDMLDKLTI